MHLTRIGNFDIARVVELEFPAFAAREFFPAITEDILAEGKRTLGNLITADDRLLMSFHAFVLRTGNATILVDTCCGNDKSRPARADFDRLQTDFLPDLARAGVKPEEVDYVMCTHLHWDHVGWNTRLVDGRWVPTFPNARYIIARREFDYWDGLYAQKGDSPHLMSFEDSVLPVKRAEQVVLVDDTFELARGIRLEPCPGHTPGLVVVHVESNGQRGIFSGDAIHHQLQLAHPHLCCRADSDMAMSHQTRRALLERHADKDTVFLPAHYPMPTAGRIVRSGSAFRFAGL